MNEPTSRQAEPTRAWVIHPELTSDRDRRDAAAARASLSAIDMGPAKGFMEP